MSSGSNLAYQRQRGFLPFHFARVDIGLNVNAQFSGCTNRASRGIADPADNGERQRAAFDGIAERRVVDQRRFLRYGIQERNDIVVPACLYVVGPLGPGLNLRVQCQTPKRAQNQRENGWGTHAFYCASNRSGRTARFSSAGSMR